MSLVIRAAARTLPTAIRDRYREQWLADARDATEVGLSPASIALAAVTFAVSYDRPLPSRPASTPELVQQRARFAAALALSAGLLGLAGFVRLSGYSGLSGITGYDLMIGLVDAFLLAFAVLGSIVAVTVVTGMRAIAPRVRAAVWVLMIAATAPLAHLAIDSFPIVQGDMYFLIGGIAYIPAAVAVVIALRLLWVGLTHPDSRAPVSLRATAISATAVLTIGVLGFTQAAVAWASRTPIAFSWLPGRGATYDEAGELVQWEIVPTQADYEQWLVLEQQFELVVNAAFTGYALLVVASVTALVVFARRLRLRPVAMAGAAIAILLIATAALIWRLDWNAAPPVVAPDLLLAIGRLLLVGVIFYAVGEMRYLARVRHRHDVEGAVELL